MHMFEKTLDGLFLIILLTDLEYVVEKNDSQNFKNFELIWHRKMKKLLDTPEAASKGVLWKRCS